jgi:sec-independent protein translocase protein TatA
MPGFGSLGGTELIIALVIILLLFGAKRIPELARGLGSGVREFRKGTRGEGEVEDEKRDAKGEQLTAGEARTEDATVEADKAEQKRG